MNPGQLTRHDRQGLGKWGKQDSNLRRLSHQIYSLAPLAAREFPLDLVLLAS